MSYLELAKKIQAGLKPTLQNAAPESAADPTEGRIVAVLIASEILGTDIWFALTDDWRPDPGDQTPVFYALELEFLKNKDMGTLRKIYATKLSFGPGLKVRQ
jgi:hypothetical protein